MTPGKRARQLFESGFYCAESVLTALAEAGGRQEELPPGIATGFCSGMSRTAGTCGAVNGAIMGIGFYGGRLTPDESVDGCYALVQDFLQRFESKHGSLNCMALLDLDFRKKEDLARFDEDNRVLECLRFSNSAANIAWDIITKAGLV